MIKWNKNLVWEEKDLRVVAVAGEDVHGKFTYEITAKGSGFLLTFGEELDQLEHRVDMGEVSGVGLFPSIEIAKAWASS